MTMSTPEIPSQARRSPSLLAQHKKRVTREVAATGQKITGSAYDLLRAQLAQHRSALKQIASTERKIEAKATYLPLYDDWVNTTLASGSGLQDEVFSTLLIWHLDCAKFGKALDMATYAMRYNLDTPATFDRSLPTTLAEEFALGYLTGKWPANEPDPVSVLGDVMELTGASDMHDQVRAKLHKAIAYAMLGKVSGEVDFAKLSRAVLDLALPHLRRALELFDGSGVKKDIERAERALRSFDKAAQATAADPAAPAQTESAAPDAQATASASGAG